MDLKNMKKNEHFEQTKTSCPRFLVCPDSPNFQLKIVLDFFQTKALISLHYSRSSR